MTVSGAVIAVSPYKVAGARLIDAGYSALPVEPRTKRPGTMQTIAELETKSGYPCVLIILDTVTRTFGSADQHQSQAMQKYVQSVDEVTRLTGAHVAAIHHSPHSDDGRAKGAIDLDGAIDKSFVVSASGKEPNRVFTLICSGTNDGIDGLITSFRLESVTLGTDAEGRVTTAPVVIQADAAKTDGSNLKGNSAKALDSLERAIAEHGETLPDGSPGFPDGVKTVTRAQWRDQFIADAKAIQPKTTDETLRKRFDRAVIDPATAKQIVEVGKRFGTMGHSGHVPGH
jgi:hypothetical protein